jgi:hypothetical protein
VGIKIILVVLVVVAVVTAAALVQLKSGGRAGVLRQVGLGATRSLHLSPSRDVGSA